MSDIDGELTRSQRRARRTLRALLDAGEEMFGRQGFHAVTIAEITECADVALGSFYNYFENRDSLIDAVLERSYQTQTRLYRLIVADSVDPVRRLTAGVAAQLLRAEVDPNWAAVCDTAAQVRRWPHETWFARSTLVLREGREDGFFDFDDLDWTVSMTIAVARAAFNPATAEREWPLAERQAVILSTLHRLVGTAEATSAAEIRWAQSLYIDREIVDRLRDESNG